MAESITITKPVAGSTPGPTAMQATGEFWGGSSASPSFSDFLSILNPLQHIPGVSTIYRAVTGDTPSPAAQIFGGALFGGVVGAVVGIANSAVQAATGGDIASQALSLLSGGAAATASEAPQVQTVVAAKVLPETGQTLQDLREYAKDPEPAPELPEISLTRFVGDPYTVALRTQLNAASRLDVKA